MKTNSFRKISLTIPVFFALLSTTFVGKGQNLVPNGDFEQYDGCPDDISELDSALFWFNPTLGTPDYYNQCANPSSAGVPNNHYGYQVSHSGIGYSGVHRWTDSFTNYREYIEVPLLSQLNPNNCYHFEMYINLGDNARYTTDAIGVYFSDTLITDFSTYIVLPFASQINNVAGNIPDLMNWTLVSGNYTANGGETYMIIGNFKNDSNTTVILVNNSASYGSAYVYIDDVSLTPCTGIEEQNQNNAITIYPNPVKDQLFIKSNTLTGKAEIKITDILGKEIYRNQFSGSNFKFPVSNFQTGIYFIEINNGKNIFRKKILKN